MCLDSCLMMLQIDLGNDFQFQFDDLFGDVMPFQSNWWLPWPKAGQESGPSKDWCYRNRLASRVQCEAYSVYMIRACPSCTQVYTTILNQAHSSFSASVSAIQPKDKSRFGQSFVWNLWRLALECEPSQDEIGVLLLAREPERLVAACFLAVQPTQSAISWRWKVIRCFQRNFREEKCRHWGEWSSPQRRLLMQLALTTRWHQLKL